MGRLDRPVRETVLVSCVCSCVRGVLLGVLRVPRVLACVRPHPASIREDRATLEVLLLIRGGPKATDPWTKTTKNATNRQIGLNP